MKRSLNKLVKEWHKKHVKFEKAVDRAWMRGDQFASRRYEGISIGLRWCVEDLQKLLKEES